VAFLIDRLGIGGTETQLLALIRHLDRGSIVPHLILLDGEDEVSRSLVPKGIPVLRLGMRSLRSLRALRQVGRLARYLRSEQIDVLQMYFPDSTYFGVVAGKLAGVKAIIRTRNNSNHWMTPTHRFLGRLLNRFVTLTICNSEAGREAVLRDERPDPASVVVIENGVDIERFAHIPPVDPTPGRARRVGMVANLRHVKGVDIFIRAAAMLVREYPDVEFIVAGEGPERPALERLIQELGLFGRFHLPGRIDDIPGFLAGLDIFVLSSRAEGTPNALLEAMAAGRPVVATAVGAIPHVLSASGQGRLIDVEDPDQIAHAVLEYLRSPELLAKDGERASRFTTSSYTRNSMLNRYHSCLMVSCGE
jgi:glycosyltransferase involved in cell wall biosynthesis